MSPWEVALVPMPMPMNVSDAVAEEALFIAEQSTGAARSAGPIEAGESLWPVLGPAFDDPAPPCVPARPSRLITDDPELAKRLKRELGSLKARVEVGEVPAARAGVEGLLEHLAFPAFPGLDVELPAWSEALRAFHDAAPWRTIPDSILFRFYGVDALRGTVAVVMGEAGEQVGIVVYPSMDDYELFLDGVLTGRPELLEQATSFSVYLAPITELVPDDLQLCRERGLVVGESYASAMLMSGGAATSAPPAIQRVMLAVMQGVTALARQHDDLSSPQQGHASTVLGEVEVRCEPEVDDHDHGPSIIEAEATIGIASVSTLDGDGMLTAFMIKVRKRDATRLAKALADVDELWLGPCGHGVVVIARADGEELGMLTHLEDPSMAQALFDAERPGLCVSAGGPTRRTVRPGDLQLLVPVRITGPGLLRLPYDPVFDGPPAQWPKASATLLAFAEPLLQVLREDGAPPSELKEAATHAATIWNAVVLSDYAGSHEALGMLVERCRDDEAFGVVGYQFIDRKRERFLGDPRVFGEVEVTTGPGGDLRVHVKATVPPGLTLGG